MIQMINW